MLYTHRSAGHWLMQCAPFAPATALLEPFHFLQDSGAQFIAAATTRRRDVRCLPDVRADEGEEHGCRSTPLRGDFEVRGKDWRRHLMRWVRLEGLPDTVQARRDGSCRMIDDARHVLVRLRRSGR